MTGQQSVSERSRSLSPCEEDDVDKTKYQDVDFCPKNLWASDRKRVGFLFSTGDGNLERSDDDEVNIDPRFVCHLFFF